MVNRTALLLSFANFTLRLEVCETSIFRSINKFTAGRGAYLKLSKNFLYDNFLGFIGLKIFGVTIVVSNILFHLKKLSGAGRILTCLGCLGLSMEGYRKSFSKRNLTAKSNAWVIVMSKDRSINPGRKRIIFERIPSA